MLSGKRKKDYAAESAAEALAAQAAAMGVAPVFSADPADEAAADADEPADSEAATVPDEDQLVAA